MDLNQWDIKSFANMMSDAVFIMGVDQEERFVYAFINNTCKKRFGYTEDIIGKTIEEGANPEMVDYLNHRYQEVLKTGETVIYSDTVHGRIDETKLDPVRNSAGILRILLPLHVISQQLKISARPCFGVISGINPFLIITNQVYLSWIKMAGSYH